MMSNCTPFEKIFSILKKMSGCSPSEKLSWGNIEKFLLNTYIQKLDFLAEVYGY